MLKKFKEYKNFKKILVANRGEIACRIIQTIQRLNIHAVAVYSDVDKNTKHVQMADSAFNIGAASASESYLNSAKIIDIAKKYNIDAIHPGYGFLSENENFATQCQNANITFIGPNAETIALMGDKAKAKKYLQQNKLKVPFIPGYSGKNQNQDYLYNQAKKIGYPLIIKATQGGGGKGMRIVNKSIDFIQELQTCQREAQASFKNNTVILEKYIKNIKHIETQIFADHFGNVVHLFTRDCSIQRRHQKIIEEAPAFEIPEVILEKLYNNSIEITKAINYIGAGTIEFLFDDDFNFYFLEMNTRLQVEHPTTEMITNLDLVEWQIKIAAKQPLPATQKLITKQGHAIEARIYAEDPENNFLPATGKIAAILNPKCDNKNIRLDNGYMINNNIHIHYDPLLAKLISWGENRNDAICKLKTALEQTHFAGITTNLSLLRKILSCENYNHYKNNKINTNFITTEKSFLFSQQNNLEQIIANAAILYLLNQYDSNKQSSHPHSPWETISNFRLNHQSYINIFLKHLNKNYALQIHIDNLNPNLYTITSKDFKNPVTINTLDQEQKKNIARLKKYFIYKNNFIYISANNYDYNFYILNHINQSKIENSGANANSNSNANTNLSAPMPGIIRKIFVKQNSTVKTTEPLIILEAMKIEHLVTAPKQGRIKNIFCREGDNVEQNMALMTIEHNHDIS